jgi:CheY-like chemotaxis protein
MVMECGKPANPAPSPIRLAALDVSDPDDFESSKPTPRKRIVVADDQQDIRDFIGFALERAGYEVAMAAEGAQALTLLGNWPADLLITDLFMLGQEGFETVSRCKAEFPRTRIIVISAGNIPGMQHDFLAAVEVLGVAATLRKPFGADTLLATVRKVLSAP